MYRIACSETVGSATYPATAKENFPQAPFDE